MVRATCENLSPIIEMVSFRCMRLLERFLTIQANPTQFCAITISSVSLCYWVHYFSVAFEKMTSLRKYTWGSERFVLLLKEFRWNGHAYGMFGGQHPHLGSEWLQFPVDLCLWVNSCCRVSCQPQQLEKIMMHVWYECLYLVKWSKIQLEILISHLQCLLLGVSVFTLTNPELC